VKVTGETFSFHHKRKRAEEARCQKHPNFQAKGRYRTELWRALYQEAPMGQFLIFRNNLTEFTLKNDFLIFLGRIF